MTRPGTCTLTKPKLDPQKGLFSKFFSLKPSPSHYFHWCNKTWDAGTGHFFWRNRKGKWLGYCLQYRTKAARQFLPDTFLLSPLKGSVWAPENRTPECQHPQAAFGEHWARFHFSGEITHLGAGESGVETGQACAIPESEVTPGIVPAPASPPPSQPGQVCSHSRPKGPSC